MSTFQKNFLPSSVGSLKIGEAYGLLLIGKIGGSSCEQNENIAISQKLSTTSKGGHPVVLIRIYIIYCKFTIYFPSTQHIGTDV